MNVASVEGFVPGSKQLQSFLFDLSHKPSERDKTNFDKKTPKDGIKLSEIDFSKVASNVNTAIQMLKDEGYEADGVKSYRMSFNGNPAETVARFNVLVKGDTNFGSKNGRAALVTEYMEFDFQADAAGNVSIIESK